jgi:fumarylacetoacetate (FAA) hydrolase
MKLATIDDGSLDGQLVVVSHGLCRAAPAAGIAPTMQAALENWTSVEPRLRTLAVDIENGAGKPFDPAMARAPLPRAYQWLDGSAFKSHMRLMAIAFKRDVEKDLTYPNPLMYQGGSDTFLGARQDAELPDEADGLDFEGEIGVVLSDVPMGTKADDAERYIKLIVLINDVSLRRIAPIEMGTGFGWLQAKPSSAFSLTAVTPDEFGAAWKDGRLELPLRIRWNGQLFGTPNGREMSFSFHRLIEHAAYSRRLSAGTIIGSGTVSNEAYKEVGSACIAERRAIELIETGAPTTEYMRSGDRVEIDMLDGDDRSIFGAIDHRMRAGSRQ